MRLFKVAVVMGKDCLSQLLVSISKEHRHDIQFPHNSKTRHQRSQFPHIRLSCCVTAPTTTPSNYVCNDEDECNVA